MGHFGVKYYVERLRLPPTSIHRWIGEWFCYNFAAGSFHIKKFRLYSFTKMANSLFEPPFGGVRGNVRTSSIARWKARDRLPIRDNQTFSLALAVQTL